MQGTTAHSCRAGALPARFKQGRQQCWLLRNVGAAAARARLQPCLCTLHLVFIVAGPVGETLRSVRITAHKSRSCAIWGRPTRHPTWVALGDLTSSASKVRDSLPPRGESAPTTIRSGYGLGQTVAGGP